MSFDKRLGFRRLYNVQKVLPAVYDDSLSYYELLCKLQFKIEELVKFYNQLADYQEVQDKALEDTYNELINLIDEKASELKVLIDLLTEGSLDYDVQHGYYIDSQDAMRDMFNDVTVHSITVGELNELDMTVAELAECGLNVRGLAVMSYWLKSEFPLLPEYQPSRAERRFTVEDLLNSTINQNGLVYVEE